MTTANSPIAYAPFPTEALPCGVRELVIEGSRAIGCDEASLALPALCVAAGVLGNSRRLRIKSTWLAPPILWGCLLGESGTSKSPAMRMVLAPLREYERRTRAALLDEPAVAPCGYGRNARAETKQPMTNEPIAIAPAPRRVVVSDATTEALAQVAAENPYGLLLTRDELAGFFGNLDRYGAQSGADEAFFLSAYDGEPIHVDRRTAREHIFVPAMALSIIGTCQPAVFAKLMTDQRRASGLLARFLLVEPPAPPKVWGGGDIDRQVISDWNSTIESLLELGFQRVLKGRESAGGGSAVGKPAGGKPASSKPSDEESPFLFDVSPQAAELYQAFYDAHNAAAAKEAGDRRAFYSKAEQLPLRLALVLHHLELVEQSTAKQVSSGTREPTRGDDMQIPTETMQDALTLTHWFTRETLRVYGLLSMEPEQRLALELEEWIRARGGKTTLAEITSEAPEKFRESKSLPEKLLGILERKSRGHWTMVIQPMLATNRAPLGNSVSTFWLKGVRRAG